tara:strand:- start:555 stop:1403 length:849 start_codon:yes stop_codon:yes gene_type:complete
MKIKEIKDLSEEYKGDNQFIWMLQVIHRTPALLKYLYIDPLVALGKATTRRPVLVNQSGKRTRLKTKDSRWLFDDPKGIGRGYLPIWHYIPRKGFVDAHEGAKYHGLLDDRSINAVDIDVLDASNRDLEDVIKALKGKRKKRIEKGKEVFKDPWKDAEDPLAGTGLKLQKESKKMKITKEELANIIKEEVEKVMVSDLQEQLDVDDVIGKIVTAYKKMASGRVELMRVLGSLQDLVDDGKIDRQKWYAAYDTAGSELLFRMNDSAELNNEVIRMLQKLKQEN